MSESILELDIHGMTQVQARTAIDAKLRRAGSGVYRLRIIHGYHSGTALRELIRTEYAHHPKVKRLILSADGGATVLVLREYV